MLLSLKRSLREEICSLPRLWVNLRTACGCPLQGAGKLSISRIFRGDRAPKKHSFHHQFRYQSDLIPKLIPELIPKLIVVLPSILPSTALDGKNDGKIDGKYDGKYDGKTCGFTPSLIRLDALPALGCAFFRAGRAPVVAKAARRAAPAGLDPRFFRVFFAPLRIASKRLLRTT